LPGKYSEYKYEQLSAGIWLHYAPPPLIKFALFLYKYHDQQLSMKKNVTGLKEQKDELKKIKDEALAGFQPASGVHPSNKLFIF
jgi:hypothetical protein